MISFKSGLFTNRFLSIPHNKSIFTVLSWASSIIIASYSDNRGSFYIILSNILSYVKIILV